MEHDFKVDIATARTRKSKRWNNRSWRWSELVERCRETARTGETAEEYARMGKEEQGDVKDVGGFVGGRLAGGVRKGANVEYRSVATLDIDHGTADTWEDFTMAFGFAAMLYSTHKHRPGAPRYRLVFPFSRKVSPAEYEPVCRKVAEALGMDLFDDTTYELPRLFYWPSTSKDAEYVFECQDGPACDVDEILAQYGDPSDVSEWPRSSREGEAVAHEMRKAGDPEGKPGLIGAFCRAYTVEDAIGAFLAGVYEPTATPGRYTYKAGSVAGGLVCYGHKYAYSHHETDPAGRRLCNAFDLCRIHLYGERDGESPAGDVTRLPSYRAMLELAREDGNVRRLLAVERQASAAADFGGVELPESGGGDGWKARLEFSKSGGLACSISNAVLILENDPALKGRLAHDEFTGADVVEGGLPWDARASQWTDRDDANLRAWMESNYGMAGREKIRDAVEAVLARHRFHPVRDYLSGLEWDRTPRLDGLVIDYLGAEDTELTRAMTRKHFTAAVARVFSPGCKYDYCLILTGPEGAGKSTLLAKMGGKWFNDSVTTMEGKEGMDQLRRAWIIELGELAGIRRSDVEGVKAFLSKQVDIYRAAYDRRAAERPRQCVFCGTTNEPLFLKGDTGNRRFWVIPVEPALRRRADWREALDRDRDQLWAEAVARYREGEELYLPERLEEEARKRQEEFNDDSDDPLAGMLRRFADTALPADWPSRGVEERRKWLRDARDGDEPCAAGVERRKFISPAEFICECMGRDMADKEYKYLARKVAGLMRKMPGWKPAGVSRHAERLYGRQKAFERASDAEEGEDDI